MRAMNILLATTSALRAKHAAAISAAAHWVVPMQVVAIVAVKPVTIMVTKAALRS